MNKKNLIAVLVIILGCVAIALIGGASGLREIAVRTFVNCIIVLAIPLVVSLGMWPFKKRFPGEWFKQLSLLMVGLLLFIMIMGEVGLATL